MKEIARDLYLNQLISSRQIPLIKVITGIRRCGKSYLLDPIFKNALLATGVHPDRIIKLDLDDLKNKPLLDPSTLYNYITSNTTDESSEYFVLLDEIQEVPNFISVLNSLLHRKNLNIYVTGSNSKFLSSDIATEFRGRSINIHIYPLSFSEFATAQSSIELPILWQEYYTYGGLPLVLTQSDPSQKMAYLSSQCQNIYLNDIIERYSIRNDSDLKTLIEILSSSAGSLINPHKLERTFLSVAHTSLSHNTIDDYLTKLEEAFIIEKAKRFDVKGKHYIDTPAKYYFTDPGLRNAFVSFRQTEENHLMENIIYTELRRRNFQVDVGVVETRTENLRKNLEVDFVANRGDNCYYIQSALTINDDQKRAQELNSLENIPDSFRKLIVTRDNVAPTRNKTGIVTLNLFDFLLKPDLLDY